VTHCFEVAKRCHCNSNDRLDMKRNHPLLGQGKGWMGQGGGKEGKEDGDCSPTSLGID